VKREPSSRRRSSVSKASTYEGLGRFWDVNDLADHAGRTRPASFTVALERRRFLVALDPILADELRRAATSRGLSAESLLNLWLKERLAG
jgi:hypothetical protein